MIDPTAIARYERALLYELACQDAEERLLPFAQFVTPHPKHPNDPSKSAFLPGRHFEVMSELVEAIERREVMKAILNVPPRHGKSNLCTLKANAWITGRNPEWDILTATYGGDFAEKFKIDVVALLKSRRFQQVFPEYQVIREGEGAIQNHLGKYLHFLGRRSPTTGKGADCLIVDDPTKDDREVRYQAYRDDVWEWFTMTLLTRRHHDKAPIIVTQCMTGDTPVTMSDGSWRRLDAVRPGESVKAYVDGQIADRRVKALVPQGEDDVLEIRTGNHRVRANARHPFLVRRPDGLEWVRAGDLRKGDKLVGSRSMGGRAAATLTEREAWLLGYMFGDGWVTIRDTVQKGRGQYVTASGKKRVYGEAVYPRRGYVTCVARTWREDEYANVDAAFMEVYGLVPKVTRFGYARTDVARVGRWFTERGLVGKAKTKRLPTYLYGEPAAVREAFVKGYLAADGAELKNERCAGRWTFGSCNEDLIRDVRHLLRGLGYAPTNIAIWRGKSAAPNSQEPVDATNCCVQTNPWSKADAAFSDTPVRTVKPVGREQVFDLTVDGAECFLADGLVVHNTRWHEDDIVGRITDKTNPHYSREFAEGWEIINLPAIAEGDDDPLGRKEGEALWPERFGIPYLEQMRAANAVAFSALYQSDPTPSDGVFFLASDIHTYDMDKWNEVKGSLRFYGASDHAVGVKQVNDPSCLGIYGIAEDGIAYVHPDLVWRRIDAMVAVDEMLRMMKTHRPLWWYAEKGHISKAIGPFLRKRMQEDGVYCPIAEEVPTADKMQRAQSSRARCAQRRILFPSFAPWWPRAKAELLKFPNARHDDFVDMLSLIGMKIDAVSGGRVVTQAREPAPGSWAALKKQFADEDRTAAAEEANRGW